MEKTVLWKREEREEEPASDWWEKACRCVQENFWHGVHCFGALRRLTVLKVRSCLSARNPPVRRRSGMRIPPPPGRGESSADPLLA